MKTTTAMVLFWGTREIYSNWHPSTFTVQGVTYPHVEQYMMAAKARLFGDTAVEKAILAATDPKKIKALGRDVKGYIDAQWVAVREQVVFEACLAKFTQNPTLTQQLLATGDRRIVEASPVDAIWGIGLGQDDPRAADPAKWQGLNLLGIVLMRVRATLREQAESAPGI